MTLPTRKQDEIEALLATRDRQRAEFVGTVSHDLKTPLNAIIGFTSVLIADSGNFSPEQARQLRLVYESARTLLGRINDLLEFHRLQAGKIVFTPEWFFPGEVLIQLAESQRGQTEQQGGEILLDLEGGPARIRTDVHLVRMVAAELLANAIRHGGPGPVRVGIQVAQSERPGSRQVEISVADSGPGMTGEQAAQLDASLDWSSDERAREYLGLGLGLALAREATIRLKGRLLRTARLEPGCRFSLVLDLLEDDLEV